MSSFTYPEARKSNPNAEKKMPAVIRQKLLVGVFAVVNISSKNFNDAI